MHARTFPRGKKKYKTYTFLSSLSICKTNLIRPIAGLKLGTLLATLKTLQNLSLLHCSVSFSEFAKYCSGGAYSECQCASMTPQWALLGAESGGMFSGVFLFRRLNQKFWVKVPSYDSKIQQLELIRVPEYFSVQCI